jgi:hypothetical protein
LNLSEKFGTCRKIIERRPLSDWPSHNEADKKKDQEYYEEHPRHIRSGSSDTAKSKYAGDDCYDETDNCPISHMHFLPNSTELLSPLNQETAAIEPQSAGL